ncbi:MAG TPA: YtxH domain-containing protein [Terriglobales bacterium]
MKWSFLTGLGLGTAVGILMAPKAGSELRENISRVARDSYDGSRDRLQSLFEDAYRRVQPIADTVGRGIRDARESVQQQAEATAARVSERLEEVTANGERQEENGGNGIMSILNEWPHERLIEIDGIGPVLASKIIQHRPYNSEEELIDSKRLPPSAIESLRNAA